MSGTKTAYIHSGTPEVTHVLSGFRVALAFCLVLSVYLLVPFFSFDHCVDLRQIKSKDNIHIHTTEG